MTLAPASPSLSNRRVLIGQVVVKLVLFAIYTGMISVLLPERVAALDPHDKVAALATISAIALAVTAVAQPVIGAFSDRTSTRFGRRLPWMAAGAAVGGIAIGAIGGAPGILILGVLWAIALPSLHGLEVSTDAYLVDAFRPSRRGFAAGIVGIAVVAGTACGAVLSGSLSSRPATATVILGGAVLVALAIFAVLVREAPTAATGRTRKTVRQVARLAAATIAAHPDFIKVLLWQFGFSIAYSTVFAYLLYIFTDLLHVSGTAAAHLIAIATMLGGIGAAASVAIGGWLSDRLRRRRLFVLLGNALIVVGDLALLARPTIPTALATAALFGLGLGLSISCGRALASQVLPNPARGAATGLGVLNTATSLGQAAAPVVGAVAIGLGGYGLTFVASIVGAVACSVAIGLVRTVR